MGFGSDTEDSVLNKLDSLSYRSLGTDLTISWLGLLWGQWRLGSALDSGASGSPEYRSAAWGCSGCTARIPGDLAASWLSQNTQCSSQSQLLPVTEPQRGSVRRWPCQTLDHNSSFPEGISPADKWQQSLPCVGSYRGQNQRNRTKYRRQRTVSLTNLDFFTRDQVLTVMFFSAASRHTK